MTIAKYLRNILGAGLTILIPSACGGRSETAASTAASASGQVPPAETAVLAKTPASSDTETIEAVAGRIAWLRSTNIYGNPGIKIETGGQVIYLDPVDLVGIKDLPKADVILVTHPHQDHFSVETIAALTKEGTIVVSTKEIGYSLSGVEFLALAPGETVEAGGLEVRSIPAYNEDHPVEFGYLGFIFSIEGVRIHCSGDTGFTPEMESLSGIDIAVLNVRELYSLSGEDTVKFAQTVKPKIIIPVHWMPDDVTFGDQAEMEYIRKNISVTTEFKELGLTP